jgi:hypothetical protein
VNHDNNQMWTRIDEPLVALDQGHQVSGSGAPHLAFH